MGKIGIIVLSKQYVEWFHSHTLSFSVSVFLYTHMHIHLHSLNLFHWLGMSMYVCVSLSCLHERSCPTSCVYVYVCTFTHPAFSTLIKVICKSIIYLFKKKDLFSVFPFVHTNVSALYVCTHVFVFSVCICCYMCYLFLVCGHLCVCVYVVCVCVHCVSTGIVGRGDLWPQQYSGGGEGAQDECQYSGPDAFLGGSTALQVNIKQTFCIAFLTFTFYLFRNVPWNYFCARTDL